METSFYWELHNLISQICPQMIGHYVPVIALLQDPLDQDPLEPEDCMRLLVEHGEDFLPISSDIPLCWNQPEDFLSSQMLTNMLRALPKDADPAVKRVLKEQREVFHQLESPSYLLASSKKMGIPEDVKVGELTFCTSQPIYALLFFQGLAEQGVPAEEIRKRYLHYETQYFINELFGIQSAGTEYPFTEFSPDSHGRDILPEFYRETLASALFSVLLKWSFPHAKQHIILNSDVARFRYRRGFQQLFIIVDSQFCQSELDLIHPFFSESSNSFLQQIIQVSFQKWQDICHYGLYQTDSSYIMDEDAVIRLAARDLTEGRGLPPYTLFNKISATRNEGNVCSGKLAFSKDETPKGLIAFDRPVSFQPENVRYIRKLLEMTGGNSKDDYILFVSIKEPVGPRILGLIPRCNCYDLYIVEFFGLLKWTLWKGGTELLSYQEGAYQYRQKRIDKELSTLSCFLHCTDENMKTIHHIIDAVKEQEHGTMVIIFRNTSDAEREVQRLVAFSRGIQLEQTKALTGTEQDKKLLLSLSAIDGALVLDKTGSIFGFGIIVDGGTSVKGTPHRGARYNSAKNYVTCCDKKDIVCAALVISEDHTLDVLCP